MRAKMKVRSVERFEHGESLKMEVVTNGSDEDNTFAEYTPSGGLDMLVTNPDLIGKFSPGQQFYIDFVEAS